MAISNSIFSLFLIYFLVNLHLIFTFNVDIKAPLVKRGPPGSYFGYSVAFHLFKKMTDTPTSKKTVLMVGAPKGNMLHNKYDARLMKVNKPGVLYKCEFDTDPTCDHLDIDRFYGDYSLTEMEDSWMGVSIGSSYLHPDSPLFVCGHLHKQVVGSHSGHGRCIKLNNNLEFESQLIPCLHKRQGAEEYGFCQAGSSADFSAEGSFLMGSPGTNNWRGSFIKRFIPKEYTEDDEDFDLSIENDRFAPFTKLDGANITNMYSYSGMSVRSGYVGSDRSKIMHISGAPRSKEVGQVDIFNSDERLTHQDTIHGEQFGSYFGHEIVVMDINRDGKDDMIVSAPFYREQGICGAIYVYMNDKGITNRVTPQKITSRRMKETECEKLNCLDARFGYSMASAGDLDGDGFNDLVVGAPYEGQGAIYIFHGRRNDLSPEPAQRIYADDLKTPFKAQAFGSSLAGSGFDVDGNGYPDILVGSYASGTAYLLFTRPVANVKFRFENLPKFVDPMKKEENCKGNACFTMRVCFILSPSTYNTMTKLLLSYSIETDTEPRARSQFYLEKRLNTNFSGQMEVTPAENCQEITTFIMDNIRDYLRPLTYELTFQAFEKPGPTIDYQPGKTIPNYNDYPVIVGVKASHILLVHFKKNCGDDEVCNSNLKLHASLNLTRSADSNNYVLRIGQDRELEVKLAVENQLEDAHQANLYITLPANIGFIGTSGKETVCNKLEEQNVVECSVGNPLPPGERVEFGVRLDPRMAMPSKEVIDLKVMVNTTSNEMDSKDNEVALKLEVIVETDLGIRGNSEPESVFYGGEIKGESVIKYEDEVGSEVKHSYEIKNIGKAHVPRSTVVISWPIELYNKHHEHGKHLLYLIEEPMLEGEGECFVNSKMINPLKLEKYRPAHSEALQEQPQQNKNVLDSNDYENNDDNNNKNINNNNNPHAIKKRAAFFSMENIAKLDCDSGTARCYQFNCSLGELRPGQSFVLRIRSRLWNSTFVENFPKHDSVEIYSKAEIIIDPNLNIRQSNINNDVLKMVTSAKPEMKEPGGVAWWIILISVLIGVLLLIGLILLLWKCGFFKRTKRTQIATHKAQMQKRPLSEMGEQQ